jgi:hypothetical protein
MQAHDRNPTVGAPLIGVVVAPRPEGGPSQPLVVVGVDISAALLAKVRMSEEREPVGTRYR